eukprot:UN02918
MDTIIVELGGSGATMVQGTGWDLPPTVDPRQGVGRMVHYKVPGDNSCLFHSIGAAYMRKNPSAQLVKDLKNVIAEEITKHPKHWGVTELGESPASYLRQLQQQSFWGGAIEIAILSAKYECEISVVDYAALCVTTFAHYYTDENNKDQEPAQYKRRVYLMYNGANLRQAHYDLVVYTIDAARASSLSGMSAGQAESDTVTDFSTSLQSIFRPTDEAALNMVKKLAEIQHARLVQDGQTQKRTWTEKDMIKNKNSKTATFTGGKGTLGETANITNHMDYKPPTTTTTSTTSTTAPKTSTNNTATSPKPSTTTTTSSSSAAATRTAATKPLAAAGPWSCEVCTFSNIAARTLCEMCQSPRPASAAPAATASAPKPTASVSQPKPTVQAQAAPKPTASTSVSQPKMATAPPPTAASTTTASRPWACPQCTYNNSGAARECQMCQSPRPGNTGSSSSSAAQRQQSTAASQRSTQPAAPAPIENGWPCSSCGTANPESATRCITCNEKKQDCNIM